MGAMKKENKSGWTLGGEREPNKWKMQKKDGGSGHPFGKFSKVGK
jgi:hypothetical protein